MRTLDTMIAIRLTKKQLRELKKAAKREKKRVGEFVRDAALFAATQQQPKPSPEL